MITPKEIEDKINSIKPYLRDEFSIEQIGYFGSFATGNFREDSDIDLLVLFNNKIGWKFFDLKDYLETVLERKVDIVTERSLKKQWKKEILQQVKYI
ncbi:nucleotidyltransferase family protein [soil metagenome]